MNLRFEQHSASPTSTPPFFSNQGLQAAPCDFQIKKMGTNMYSPEQLVDHCQLIAEGTLSACYKAVERSTSKTVALLKPIQELEPDEFLEALKSYIRADAFLGFIHNKQSSPHIEPRGRLYSNGQQNNTFRVTELFDKALLDCRPEEFNFSERCDLFCQALLAVKECLNHDIYHLDLSPANFYLKEGRVFLGDVGDAFWLPKIPESGLKDKIFIKEVVTSNLWGEFQGSYPERIEIVSAATSSSILQSENKGNLTERINNIRDRLLCKKDINGFNSKYMRLRADFEKEMVFQMGMLALNTILTCVIRDCFEGTKLIDKESLLQKLSGLSSLQSNVIVQMLDNNPVKRPSLDKVLKVFLSN